MSTPVHLLRELPRFRYLYLTTLLPLEHRMVRFVRGVSALCIEFAHERCLCDSTSYCPNVLENLVQHLPRPIVIAL